LFGAQLPELPAVNRPLKYGPEKLIHRQNSLGECHAQDDGKVIGRRGIRPGI